MADVIKKNSWTDREREREWERESARDRETDRQTDRPTERQTDRQREREREREREIVYYALTRLWQIRIMDTDNLYRIRKKN